MQPIDNIVYKTFVSKFNDKYSDSLISEQKELLNKYIVSFVDNGIEFKTFYERGTSSSQRGGWNFFKKRAY